MKSSLPVCHGITTAKNVLIPARPGVGRAGRAGGVSADTPAPGLAETWRRVRVVPGIELVADSGSARLLSTPGDSELT